jgi:hypothetical protein
MPRRYRSADRHLTPKELEWWYRSLAAIFDRRRRRTRAPKLRLV